MGSFPSRNMQLHEYHAAQIVRYYHVPIPLGNIAFNSKEAYAVARRFGNEYNRNFMVKAQIQVFGRKYGHFLENDYQGGIHRVENIDDVADCAEKMLGKRYVSVHTGPHGYVCNCVYI